MKRKLQRNGDQIELQLSECSTLHVEHRLDFIEIATLGYGFLDAEILAGKSRFPCGSHALTSEIQQLLLPSARSDVGFRNPKPSRTDALLETLISAALGTYRGISMLQIMRKTTSRFYNADEFLGDCDSTLKGNIGTRLRTAGFDYRHVPLTEASPSAQLLSALPDCGWVSFRDQYRSEIAVRSTALIRQILESVAIGHLPVLLCCEPFVSSFGLLTDSERAHFGCHRFLAAEHAAQIFATIGLATRIVHLRPNGTWKQRDAAT